MAITITNDGGWSTTPHLCTDDDCIIEWISDNSSNLGYHTMIHIVEQGVGVIYVANRYDFTFNLKPILSSYKKLNPNATITQTNFNFILVERWLSNNQIVQGAQVSSNPFNLPFLKGTLENGTPRVIAMSRHLTRVPKGAYYYDTPTGYDDDIIAVSNDLSNVSVISRDSIAGQLGLIKQPLDCGNLCQLIWRNDFSAKESFLFTHNYIRNLKSEGITWGYPVERTIVKQLTDGITVYSGQLNYITYKWLVEELLKSPFVEFRIILPDQSVVRKKVIVEDTAKEIERDEFGETLTLALRLRFSDKRKSIRT